MWDLIQSSRVFYKYSSASVRLSHFLLPEPNLCLLLGIISYHGENVLIAIILVYIFLSILNQKDQERGWSSAAYPITATTSIPLSILAIQYQKKIVQHAHDMKSQWMPRQKYLFRHSIHSINNIQWWNFLHIHTKNLNKTYVCMYVSIYTPHFLI